MAKSPHVLLVGGGHANVALLKRARAWTEAGAARVTLLSDHPTLYYSGMVPEYVGGVYTAAEVQIDLEAWCCRVGVAWQRGRAAQLDPAACIVRTAGGAAFSFDLAVFDIGARNPAAPPGVISTKPLHRIARLERFVRAALASGEEHRLVIAGGGAAGAETALNLSGRLRGSGQPGTLRIALAEPAGRLLPGFPEGMGAHVCRVLRRRGVDVRLGVQVQRVEDGRAALDPGGEVACDEVLWATGSRGHPVFRKAGLPCDERGFVRVRPSLQCHGAPHVFAAGDCAVVDGHEGLARVGVHAVKQGTLLAQSVERAVKALRAGRALPGTSFDSFKPYPLAPLILSTGGREGLWTAGGYWLRGAWVLRLKHFIDLRWMNRYRLPPASRWTIPEMLHARAAYAS